jgi:hypothetical protein
MNFAVFTVCYSSKNRSKSFSLFIENILTLLYVKYPNTINIINSGYLGLDIKLSNIAKNPYLGKLEVNNVDNKLHVNLVNVIPLLLICLNI